MTPAPTRLFLLRHAESEWNAQLRWQGRGDPPLSDRGRRQSQQAVSRIADQVEVAASSPQRRALETAEIFAQALGLGGVHIDDGLQEIDVGEWTGMHIDDVESGYGPQLAAWRAGELDAPPGGEDRTAFLARVLSALGRIRETFVERRVLVVTHGGVIGRLERHLGCHPGRGSGNLTGRWFELNGELQAVGDRIPLLDEPQEPAPETR